MSHDPTPLVPRTVAILGAGAVGGYFGAMLARAGTDVTLIGRPAHVDAIARDGLRVLQDEREWSVRVRAAVDADAARDADVVLVTVKTPDTEDAARTLAPHLRADARVVSLQNGVDNAARIAAVLPQPVYAAVVYVGCYMEGPGCVRHTGRGDLVLGVPRALATRGDPVGDLQALASMFEHAGVACPTSPDIEAALWTKLTLNCAFNAISALGNARYGRMAGNPLVRSVMEAAVRETVAVARAEGVALDPDRAHRRDLEARRRDGGAILVDRAGRAARETDRDRCAQRPCRAARSRAGHSDTGQPHAACAGETARNGAAPRADGAAFPIVLQQHRRHADGPCHRLRAIVASSAQRNRADTTMDEEVTP